MTLNARPFVRPADCGANIGVIGMLIAFTLIGFFDCWTDHTLANVLHFSVILGCLAMGEALVVMSKEIDLSVGSVYGLGRSRRSLCGTRFIRTR